MRYLQKLSPILSLLALVVAVGTAVITSLAPPGGWVRIVGSGSTASSPLGHPELTRVMFPVQMRDDSPHHNNMVSLTHNWHWDASNGWTRDDPESPSVALTLESFYNGLAELNFDMRPPGPLDPWPGGRAMGFAARHDGSYSTLTIGGTPYNAGSAGVKLTGGTGQGPVVAIFEGQLEGEIDSLRVLRPNGTTSVGLRGGSNPSLAFGLAGETAWGLDDGVLRIAGDAGTKTLINIAGPGPDAAIVAVRAARDDDAPQFAMAADGRLAWGDGKKDPDVSLRRAGPGRIETNGELAVAGLRIGGGAALQSVRLHQVDLVPASVSGRGSRDEVFAIPALADGSLVFINAPQQPAAIAVAGARVAGEGRVAVRFINTSDATARPAPGRYAILVVEPSLGE